MENREDSSQLDPSYPRRTREDSSQQDSLFLLEKQGELFATGLSLP